jgi:hypothetical protein
LIRASGVAVIAIAQSGDRSNAFCFSLDAAHAAITSII